MDTRINKSDSSCLVFYQTGLGKHNGGSDWIPEFNQSDSLFILFYHTWLGKPNGASDWIPELTNQIRNSIINNVIYMSDELKYIWS